MSDPRLLCTSIHFNGCFGRFGTHFIIRQGIKFDCPIGGRDQVKDGIVPIISQCARSVLRSRMMRLNSSSDVYTDPSMVPRSDKITAGLPRAFNTLYTLFSRFICVSKTDPCMYTTIPSTAKKSKLMPLETSKVNASGQVMTSKPRSRKKVKTRANAVVLPS